MNKIDSPTFKTPQKDYTELVYWVWQYFSIIVIVWIGLVERWWGF